MTGDGPSGLACLEPREGGVAVSVKARPSAPRTRVTGIDESRGELAIDVAAPPEGGKATRELSRYLRRLLGAGSVELLKGQTDRHKVFLARGISVETAITAIRGALDEG